MIKYGFQTYTWQMSYEKYAGKIKHIVDVTSRCGMTAVEAEICMLKDYFDKPEELLKIFAEKNIEFGALCLVCDWLNPRETEEEFSLAEKAVKYVKEIKKAMPDIILALCQMPQKDRGNLNERRKNALSCVNSAAKRAHDAGIPCVFHPNSPAGSVFRTHEDYKIMLDGLDSSYIGFAPDSGHIIKGGMNVYDIFRDYISVIKHAHFKDIDKNGTWRVMGEGITDFVKITKILNSCGYNGYIMVEDESPEAEINPDAVALHNAEFITKYL